jgi:predicted phosphohydrolase
MWLETLTIDNYLLLPDGSLTGLSAVAPMLESVPLVQFYPGHVLLGDYTNYWAPNLAALRAMLSEARFSIEETSLLDERALVRCRTTEDPELDRFVQYARGELEPERG